MTEGPENHEIAGILEQIAHLLELEDANPYRVQAYRKAAATAREADRSLRDLVEQAGKDALQALPEIGPGLAGVIEEIVQTGQASQLRKLQAEHNPTAVLSRVPGIGSKLASRVQDELGVTSLEELEVAAHDGRLGRVKGFGEGRVAAVKDSLAGMLSPAARRRARQAVESSSGSEREPTVAALLDVDREYRRRAGRGELKKIAPRRFNPDNEAWLPILNTTRGPWAFTALYSNTKRAHELGKTDDWVVIYFKRNGQPEGQCTVVTETDGDLTGQRAVRGRERETGTYYQEKGTSN